MKRHNHKGFSLIELLIAMIAGAILLVSAGILSGRSLEVQKRTQQRAEIYNDLTIVLRMMEKHIRESYSATIEDGSGDWVGQRIFIQPDRFSLKMAFGLYQSQDGLDLVYVPEIDNEATRQVLFSVPSQGIISMTLGEDDEDKRFYTITINGIKKDIPFSISTQARRRRET